MPAKRGPHNHARNRLFELNPMAVCRDVTQRILDEAMIETELALKCRVLATNGVWQVPPGERFQGWERLGVKEQR